MHTAREIFGMENLEDIQPLVAGKLWIRDEVRLMQLVTSLSTQGFELKDFEQTAEANIATVQDVTDQDEVGRMAHALQFPYVLWKYFPKESSTVKYMNRHAKLKMECTARDNDCARCSSGEIKPEELASRVDIKLHN